MNRHALIEHLTRLGRFGLVGGLAACVDLGGMLALIELGAGPLVARAVALTAAMCVAWQLNRHFTFGASDRHIGEEAARYAVVAGLAAVTNYGVFAALLALVPGIWPLIAAIIGIGVSMWVSFFGFQRFAFSRRRSSLVNGQTKP